MGLYVVEPPLRYPAALLRGSSLVSNAYNNLEACKNIKIPALMVHGSDDIIVEPMAAVETWKAIEGSQLLMIPLKGHGVIFEDTEYIKDKIVSFIKVCS